jgi:hypothetical protein
MAKAAQDRETQSAWERAWSERYGVTSEPEPQPRRRAPHRAPLRDLLIATAVLGIAVTSIAIADTGESDPAVNAARGEGDAITLGDRNPGSGESTRETAIVANAGNGGLVLRPSNTAKGGRAVSATCDNDGTAPEDGCAVYVNKGTGAAASFRTQGSVPFAIRDTNSGLVQHLNSDMVDGKHATDFLARSDASSFLGASAKAADSETLDGQDSSAFLGASAKAADSETVDGQDSSAFLGATAKATDADKLDGIDSLDVVRLAGAVFVNGNPANIGYTSSKTSTGVYRVEFPAGTFKTANSCKTPRPMVVSHSDTAVIATVAIGMATCSAVDGTGGFTARMFTLAGAPVDSAFWFMVM